MLHPDFLLEVLTSEQLSEWEAYNQIDPIGKWRDADYGWSYLASLITNIMRLLYSKKGETVELTTVLDFLPDWHGGKKTQQSVETMKENLLAAFRKKPEKDSKGIKAKSIKK